MRATVTALQRVILAEREACARAICRRCAEGHAVGRNTWGDWEHGCDWLGEVGIPPEPCAAAAIWARGGLDP